MKHLIFLSLIACTSLLDEYHFEIAKEAQPFVNKFYLRKQELNRNLIIEFTSLIKTDGVLGKTFYGDINKVKLDTSLIRILKYDPLFFETILYHELGHAVLNRTHCYDCYSLMNPNKYIDDYRQDSIKRQILINELLK